MTPDEIKRLRYYEKQYLRTQDFQDEQSYHIEMRRRHSIAHHSWGIVAGLEIQQDPISKVWTVQPGMAVDGYGREIVVFAPERLDTSQIAAQLASASLKIWIAYKIEKLDLPPSGYRNCDGKDDFTRILESFRLIYQNDPPIDSAEPKPSQKLSDDPNTARWPLCLGKITWNNNAIESVDLRDRHYIGAVASQLLVPDNELLIRGKNKSTPSATPADPTYDDVNVKLSGTLQVTNYLTVGPFTATTGGGGIDVTGSGAEFGFVKRTLTAWPSSPAAGDRFVWYNPDGNARLWTEKTGDLFIVTSTGKVGIGTGTTIPSARLQLSQPILGTINLFPEKGADFSYDGGDDSQFWFVNSGMDTGQTRFRWDRGNGTSSRDLLVIKNNGNIGIGTTDPSARLQLFKPILGTINMFPEARADFSYDGGDDNLFYFAHSGSGTGQTRFRWDNGGSGSDLLVIKNNGNIGIGTTDPSSKLDVSGSIKADSLLLSNGTLLSKIQSGTASVGSNLTNKKQVTVNFPVRFSSVPKVIASARSQTNSTDTFAVTTRSISTTQFTVNLIILDSATSWTQNLQLDWMAWE